MFNCTTVLISEYPTTNKLPSKMSPLPCFKNTLTDIKFIFKYALIYFHSCSQHILIETNLIIHKTMFSLCNLLAKQSIDIFKVFLF